MQSTTRWSTHVQMTTTKRWDQKWVITLLTYGCFVFFMTTPVSWLCFAGAHDTWAIFIFLVRAIPISDTHDYDSDDDTTVVLRCLLFLRCLDAVGYHPIAGHRSGPHGPPRGFRRLVLVRKALLLVPKLRHENHRWLLRGHQCQETNLLRGLLIIWTEWMSEFSEWIFSLFYKRNFRDSSDPVFSALRVDGSHISAAFCVDFLFRI